MLQSIYIVFTNLQWSESDHVHYSVTWAFPTHTLVTSTAALGSSCMQYFTLFSRMLTSSPSNGCNVAIAWCLARSSLTTCSCKTIQVSPGLSGFVGQIEDGMHWSWSSHIEHLAETWNSHLQLPGLVNSCSSTVSREVEYSRHGGNWGWIYATPPSPSKPCLPVSLLIEWSYHQTE